MTAIRTSGGKGICTGRWTRVTAAEGVEDTLRMLEGRWKLRILFVLFGGQVLRFSDLERAVPGARKKCSPSSASWRRTAS